MMRRCLIALVLLLPMSSLGGAADTNTRYLNLVAKRKYAETAALLTKAANANNAEAQYRLAVMLRSGLGVKRDEARARKLLKRAAAAGHKQAQTLLETLTKLVTTGRNPVQPKPSLRRADMALVRDGGPEETTDLAFAAVRPFSQFKVLADVRPAKAVTKDGKTPLMLAASAGNLKATRALFDHTDIDSTDKSGKTALHQAVHKGHGSTVEFLLENGTTMAAAAGVLAARRCDDAMASRLRRAAGPRLQESDVTRQIEAFAAHCEGAAWFVEDVANTAVANAESWSATMTLALKRRNHTLLQALLSQGSDPAVLLAGGTPALGLASALNDEIAVSMLLGAGADPAVMDADGNTPLMLAAAHGAAPVLNQLLSNAQDLNIKNADGKTALYIAVESLNVEAIRLISAAGGAATSRSIARDTPEKLAERLGRVDMIAALQGR